MKKHIATGGIIYTDSHMSYCNSSQGVSKLSKYGWYHYWTNHSVRMVHEKFPFCHSMSMEAVWGDLKRTCVGMKFTLAYDKIQEFCDEFMMKRRFLKQRCTYDFTMRAIHHYYRYHYNKLLQLRHFNEEMAPIVGEIENNYEGVAIEKNMLGKGRGPSGRRLGTKRLMKNIDLCDLSITRDPCDFDKSFLRMLDVSIACNKKEWEQVGLQIKLDHFTDAYITRKNLERRAKGVSQNWIPVWPQLEVEQTDEELAYLATQLHQSAEG